MASATDYMSSSQPDIGSRTSTSAIPPAPEAKVATSATPAKQEYISAPGQTMTPKPTSLPFSPTPASSPVYTNAAGKAKTAGVQKQATALASSLDKPPAPAEAAPPAPLMTPGGQGLAPVPRTPQTATYDQMYDAQGNPISRTGFIDKTTTGTAPSMAPTTSANIQGTPESGTKEPGLREGYSRTKYGKAYNGVLYEGQYMGMTPGQVDEAIAAGEAAGKKYDPSIQSLDQQSREEQAKALIRGGQAGGFMSTQIAGKAANSVGANWVGSGGTLNRLKQEYDRSLTDLQNARRDAIQNTRNMTMTAYRTGNQAILDQAQTAGVQIKNIEEAINSHNASYQDQIKALSNIQKLERGDASETISSLVENGYTADSVPESYLQDLDTHLQAGGMPPGSAKMIFATQAKVRAAQEITDEVGRQKAEIGNAKEITGILKDIPVGRSINIAGQDYMGLSHGDIKTGTETNNQGKVTAWSFNPEDGTTVSTDLGYIGKAADGWAPVQTDQGWFNYNAKTGQSVPLEPSVAQTTWQTFFPEGSQSPFRDSKDPYQGQCGALVNDLYGPNSPVHIGNSFKEKVQALDGYKVDPSDAQVGDTFLMSAGDTGHIGIIAGVKPGPDGKQIVTCLESNMQPPGGGKISTTRTMALNDPRLKMIARVPTDPNRLPPAGPDSPFTRAAMGQLTIGGKPISQMFGEKTKPLSASELKAYQDMGYDTTPGMTVEDVSKLKPIKVEDVGTEVDPHSKSILAQTGLSNAEFNYLTQGTSALSRLSASQRQQIMGNVEKWANKSGVDVSTFQSQYKAYNDVVQSNIQRQNKTKVMEREVLGTLENVDTAANEAGLGKITSVNAAKMLAGQQFNDPAMQKYATHLNQLVTEMAGYNAATQGKNSPDLVDLEDAKSVILRGFSSGGVKGFRDAIEASTDKMKTVMQESVIDARRQVWDLFGVGERYDEANVPISVPPKEPESLPANFSKILEKVREGNKDDSSNLDSFLQTSYGKTYSDIIDQLKSKGKSPTEILDALSSPDE